MADEVVEQAGTVTPDAGMDQAQAPAEGQAAQTAATEGDSAASAVPEAYEFAAPDGIELDPSAVEAFSAFAKEAGLSQEQAQKAADIAISMRQREAQAFAEQVGKWAADAAADPEFGGDKFEANLAIARKAIDQFGGDSFKSLLDTSGFGNHPEVIRAFYRAGLAISDDAFIPGRTTSAQPKDTASVMFPTMN